MPAPSRRLLAVLPLLALALGAGLAAQSPPRSADPPSSIRPVAPRAKPARYVIPAGWEQHAFTVKFRDGLTVRLRAGRLSDLGTGALDAAARTAIEAIPGAWSRSHQVAEGELDRLRALGEANVGFPLHDLNLQFRCALPAHVDAALVIDSLNALGCVEYAEALPGAAPPPQGPPPDLRGEQMYAEASPRGIGAGTAHGFADAFNPTVSSASRGINTRIANIEYGFQAHADLPPIGFLTPPGWSTPAYDVHGTAVLGQLFSNSNDIGTTGLAPAALKAFAHARTPVLPGFPQGLYAVDSAITVAASWAGVGGIVLIEQQVAGPLWNGLPTSQIGMLPVEWHVPTWQAIRLAAAAGVVVVEAAGNGSQNLDHPMYGGAFSIPNDSGAILVGAGAAPIAGSTPRARIATATWGSNYGETLDLQGQGESVVTTGYGDRYAGLGPHEHYTAGFNGTSSASPIVVAACAIVQSMHQDKYGFMLSPAALRAALRRSGSVQGGLFPAPENIGPLPDVVETTIELGIHRGFELAHGFDQPFPGLPGQGLDAGPFNVAAVHAMATFDEDGPGPKPPSLFVAGEFGRAGGVPVNNIARWNGVGWSALGNGLGDGVSSGYNGAVMALAVHDVDGPGAQLPQLYAGGLFSLAGTVPTRGIARWNGTSWSAVGGGFTGPSPYVYSLTVLDEDGAGPLAPSLIAGGEFQSVGALTPQRVARWRNNAWSTIGLGLDGRVAALESYDADGAGPAPAQIVAGGLFLTSGGMTARGLATWTGASWVELGGGTPFPGDQVLCLETVAQPLTADLLFVGGFFSQLGSTPTQTPGLAIWTGFGWSMPSGPAANPFSICAHDDGMHVTLPRRDDVFFACASGVHRLDLQINVFTPLPVTAAMFDCLHSFDEDGPAGAPAALFIASNGLLGGNAQAFTLGRWLGSMPMAAGITTVVPTSCGGPYAPTIAATWRPAIAAQLTVQFESLPLSLPILLMGAPEPLPLPLCAAQASCALGVQPIEYLFGGSHTFQVPSDAGFLGQTVAFQGMEVLALPYGALCLPPALPFALRATDTLRLTF